MSKPVSARVTIAELEAESGNESAHARHVADLALKLFDLTHDVFGAPPGDRRLLEAACLLHDIGYAADPRHHADWAARLVRRKRLAGFSPENRAWIAALIQLHPASLGLPAARARIRRIPADRRILYAAFLLRLADALDHAHVQDAAVISAQAVNRCVRVRVRCSLFPASVEVARRQAGRWRGALPVDIDLRATAAGPQAPLLPASLTLHEAVRRMVWVQYRTLRLNVDGALQAASEEPLHDLRIAVRRARSILWAFRRQLTGTSATRINADLQQLNRTLGIARDLDVWIGFFSDESVSEQFTGHRLWPKFLAHQVELRRLQQSTVRRQLHGSRFNSIQARIERFLRVELPAAATAAPALPLDRPAARAMTKSLRRALRLGRFRASEAPDKLHKLRIALRRLRYLGSFFGDALGRPIRKLSKRTHALERVLGEMRDADLALGRILQEGPPPPRMLVRRLQRIRESNAASLKNSWNRFQDPQVLLAIRRELKEHDGGKSA